MAFCTAINCMDGRVQLPVITYLQTELGTEYVDNVTEPAPAKLLSERTNGPVVDRILSRVNVSTKLHGSRTVAVVAHCDCTGNPLPEAEQRAQLREAVDFVWSSLIDVLVLGLWVDCEWSVSEAERREPPAVA